MGKKVIKLTLNTTDINKAIRELEQYEQEFQKKVDAYRQRIAEEIEKMVSINFGGAILEDVIGTIVDNKLVPGGSPRKPEVTVDVSHDGDISIVVAKGEDAIWCEFGAGVYHNGAAGSSPHPYGKDLSLTIGSYGFGRGKQTSWGYSKDGKVFITRGTPASMPMYNAVQDVTKRAIEIAREVFQ